MPQRSAAGSGAPAKRAPTAKRQLDADAAAGRLDAALDRLAGVADAQRAAALGRIYKAVASLMEHEAGARALVERGARFDSAGVFRGGAWARAERLLAHLVPGGLLADDVTASIEIMSEMRMLAIADGRLDAPISSQDAREFLRRVLVLCLPMLSPTGSEDERVRPKTYRRARALLTTLLERLSPSMVRDAFVAEVDALCAQRPIQTTRARTLIAQVVSLPGVSEHEVTEKRLELYALAVGRPSPLSQAHPDAADYERTLASTDDNGIEEESRSFATALRLTGLGNRYHATLVRHLAAHAPTRIGPALGLDAMGEAALQQQLDVVCELIHVAITPETCDALYGLARALERGLLSRRVVVKSLQRIATLSLHASATKLLMSRIDAASSVHANTLLLAGAISVLGQPLGIGQGNNPTCQSARALSLWSAHAPGYLLSLLIRAASDGRVELEFEGAALASDQIAGGVAQRIDPDLDAVSLILVPHLDRLYDAMALRASGRDQDLHRWVNPALYGRWVPLGFACAIHPHTRTVTGYERFVRLFYATHHPAYNDGEELLYPNPVGVLVTNVHGKLLGAHAVSLLRVDPDPRGEMRAYFFNPNNEGRQAWGESSVVSVSGNGEIPGESSLPFARFAARLYAFHYHPLEGGDPDAVPDALVESVTADSRASWGLSYAWSAE